MKLIKIKRIAFDWSPLPTEGLSALNGTLGVVPVYEFEDKPRWRVVWCGPSKNEFRYETSMQARFAAEELALKDLPALAEFFHQHKGKA